MSQSAASDRSTPPANAESHSPPHSTPHPARPPARADVPPSAPASASLLQASCSQEFPSTSTQSPQCPPRPLPPSTSSAEPRAWVPHVPILGHGFPTQKTHPPSPPHPA